MQLTDHFGSDEFAQPAKPTWGPGFIDPVPYPLEWIQDRLIPLCQALEAIREACGENPVRVLSGFRSYGYNEELYRRSGKTPTDSQHSRGKAVDIVVNGVTPGVVHQVTLDLFKSQKIEIGGLGLYTGFVHIDIRPRPTNGHLAQWNGSRTAEQTA